MFLSIVQNDTYGVMNEHVHAFPSREEARERMWESIHEIESQWKGRGGTFISAETADDDCQIFYACGPDKSDLYDRDTFTAFVIPIPYGKPTI